MTRLYRPICLIALACFTIAGAPATAAEPTLQQRIDAVIKKAHDRELRSDQHTPWVIMHAVIAFEKDMTVTDAQTGKTINAIDFLLTQATYDGKRIYRNDDGEPALPTRGISYGMKQSFKVQDHVDQFLMAFADAGVPLAAKLTADDGTTFTVADKLAAAKANLNDTQEVGWTLVAMSTYLTFDDQWKAKNGKTYDIETIMKIAVQRDTNRETEGGPHHLYGVAYALQHWQAQGGATEGTWADARDYLMRHVEIAKRHQQEDGSFSVAMFRGSALARTPRHLVWATGHTLEWLAISLTPEQLTEPWVTRAVTRLVEVMEKTPTDLLSDGGLYHAAHALRLYRAATRAK